MGTCSTGFSRNPLRTGGLGGGRWSRSRLWPSRWPGPWLAGWAPAGLVEIGHPAMAAASLGSRGSVTPSPLEPYAIATVWCARAINATFIAMAATSARTEG